MLPLESPQWATLQHAYGSARDIPSFLRQLSAFPSADGGADEPWFSLWSALYHQGDVSAASFAATPHIIHALATAPRRATHSYFLLPASIELGRRHSSIAVPPDLEAAYFQALSRLPQLAGVAAQPDWNPLMCQSALAAFAAGTGNKQLSKLLLEIESGDIEEILTWYFTR